MIEARVGDTTVGLTAIVSRNGVAQTSETVTVKIGNADVTDSFLDFNDDTFKTAGWTTKSLTLAEDSSESGCYKTVWDSSSAVTAEARLFALYEIASGNNASFDKEELFFSDSASTPPTAAAIADAVWDETRSDHVAVGSTGQALDLVKKVTVNRFEVAEGTSSNGTVYEDDDTTPALTADIKDKDDNAITIGSSEIAKRTRFS